MVEVRTNLAWDALLPDRMVPPGDCGDATHRRRLPITKGGHPRLRRVLAEDRRVRAAVVEADDLTITTGILACVILVARGLVAARASRQLSVLPYMSSHGC